LTALLPHSPGCGSSLLHLRRIVAPSISLPFGSPDSGLRLLDADWQSTGSRSTLADVFDESARWQAAKAGRYRLSCQLPSVTLSLRFNTPRYNWP